MNRSELVLAYFDWMYQLVFDSKYYPGRSYRKLFNYLNNIDFVYSHPMDSNRVEDGIDLRYRFGYDAGVSDTVVASYLDDHPCSVFEMMVALALRTEEAIMFDPSEGDRTAIWFKRMLENLNLADMSDAHFNQGFVDDVIFRFLNRDYLPNGAGGLFYIEDCTEDLRTVEIWCQLCWYLDRYF